MQRVKNIYSLSVKIQIFEFPQDENNAWMMEFKAQKNISRKKLKIKRGVLKNTKNNSGNNCSSNTNLPFFVHVQLVEYLCIAYHFLLLISAIDLCSVEAFLLIGKVHSFLAKSFPATDLSFLFSCFLSLLPCTQFHQLPKLLLLCIFVQWIN